MATVDAASVKKLREMTNAGIMDCKSALTEAEGDFERASQILREKGIASAGKKADRATGEGSIGVFVSDDGKRGALVEVNCETDFVAKNERFVALAQSLAKQAATSDANDVTGLNSVAMENGATVEETVKEAVGTLGENIRLGRVARLETSGHLGVYAHHDGKQAALVELTGDGATPELGRDVATQVVALRPLYVTRDEIPATVLDAEKQIYAQQAAQEGKPEAIQMKIAEGRLAKEFYGQVCLMDQPFIKEQKQTVAQYIKATAPGVQVTGFARFKVGESA